MASSIETNPYLKDPEQRRRLLERNAYDSSVFEGATGLPKPEMRRTPEELRSEA